MSASNIHDDDALFQQAQKLISLITNIENVPKPKFGQAIRVWNIYVLRQFGCMCNSKLTFLTFFDKEQHL